MSSYVSRLYKNAIKAENEVVKASINGDKPFNWYYGKYTEGNMDYDCITEGHVIVAFGFDTFALNKSIFEAHNKVLHDGAISQFVHRVDATSFEAAHIVGTKVLEGNRKYTYCVLKKDSTGEEILFNEKFRKFFTDDVEYKVFNDITAVQIYSGDIFLGAIMPITVNK